MKQLTRKQMEFLSKFEGGMRTAVNSQWVSPVSQTEFQQVVDILNDVLEANRRANANCASCLLENFTDIGRLYFARKTELEKESLQAAQKKQVATRPTKTAKVAGVAVKTSKTK